MAWHAFSPHVALDDTTGTLVTEGSGYVVPLGSPDDATPLAVTDLGGVSLPGGMIPVVNGLVTGFRVEDHSVVRWVAGERHVTIWSPGAMEAAAQASATAAATAADAAAAAVMDAIDDAVEAHLLAEGYAPLRIVQHVEDIPPGTPPGVAFLVVDAEEPVAAPQVVGATSASSSSGTSLLVDVPEGVQAGDWLFCFATAQTDSAASWSSPQWDSTIFSPAPATDVRTTAIGVHSVFGAPPSQIEVVLSASNQRRACVVVAVRGCDTEADPWVVGAPSGLNGVGTDDTTVPAISSPTPRALHLVAGWSNGNVTSGGQSPAAPAVDPSLTLLDGGSVPASPTAGFTTLRVWARELTTSGSSGAPVLDWPMLSQRAGVAVVVKPPAGA